MGLFGKSKKKADKEATPVPSLPELPKLPEFPSLEGEDGGSKSIHKLPSYPSGSLGTKFSQNTIKEAVSGEKEDFPEDGNADDFIPDDEEEVRMMQEPLKKPITEEIGWGASSGFGKGRGFEGAEPEPIFIRIDRFEEALKIFNETKKKLHEIERTLEDIKKVREKEETELSSWENKVKTIKGQIEKVDKNFFSKI